MDASMPSNSNPAASEMTAVGNNLRQAREAQGLSTAQVADKLKLTVRQIEALEADDASRLPDKVFVRGFIRNYARLLGLDAEVLLGHEALRQGPTETITAPSEGLSLATTSVQRWVVLPVFVLMLFMFMVGGLYYWLRQGESTLVPAAGQEAPHHEVTQPAQIVSPEPAITSESGTPATNAPAITSAATTVDTPPVPDGANPAQAPGLAVPQAKDTTPETRAPSLTPSLTAAKTGEAASTLPGADGTALRFRAQKEAWIRVEDHDGKSSRNLLGPGSIWTVRGTPPFTLVVGNAASVQLEYNGRNIDLRPFIGEKVARLTLE